MDREAVRRPGNCARVPRLDVVVLVQEDIWGLYVSVKDALGVDVLEAGAGLCKQRHSGCHTGDLGCSHRVLCRGASGPSCGTSRDVGAPFSLQPFS